MAARSMPRWQPHAPPPPQRPPKAPLGFVGARTAQPPLRPTTDASVGPPALHATSREIASSVPGSTHTAVVASSWAAKPRVPVPKLRVVILSPTLAARDFTLCRL